MIKQYLPQHKADYQKQKWNSESSLHYVFYFQKDSLAERDIKDIIDLKERYYTKILKWLNLENDQKIDYYIYPNLKEKYF